MNYRKLLPLCRWFIFTWLEKTFNADRPVGVSLCKRSCAFMLSYAEHIVAPSLAPEMFPSFLLNMSFCCWTSLQLALFSSVVTWRHQKAPNTKRLCGRSERGRRIRSVSSPRCYTVTNNHNSHKYRYHQSDGSWGWSCPQSSSSRWPRSFLSLRSGWHHEASVH